ncbi:MAG: adenylate/guanylate cyclase domain-containing protein [Tepidisphaeraceae bacterium]
MKIDFSPTLRQVFLLTLAGLLALLGLLFFILLDQTEKTILTSSDRLLQEVGLRLENQVVLFRDQATEVAGDVERDLQHQLADVHDRQSVERALYAELLNHPDVSEVTFTHGDAIGEDDFQLVLAPADRWQVSAYRGGDGADAAWIMLRVVTETDPVKMNFTANIVDTRQSAGLNAPSAPAGVAPDPTIHPTFATVTLRINRHALVWSDLHFSEISTDDPAGQRRVEVTVQKAVFNGQEFLGVVRVGLLQKHLEEIVARSNQGPDPTGKIVPHTCFLCDAQGRLVTPVAAGDHLAASGDDLRVASASMPPQIAQALLSPKLSSMLNWPQDWDPPPDPASDRVNAGGMTYLVRFLPIAGTQQWVLGVVGAQNDFLGGLIAARTQLLKAALVVMAIILVGGALTLRAVQRGLKRVVYATTKMREFDFTAAPAIAPFRDIRSVMESLEQAKTAMRAMGKYVPIDLVRDLYEMNHEPMLGGEIRDLSIMFTDIEGFTTISENLSADHLAAALGFYLNVVTGVIHDHAGTIDKFIGDSVMTLWNAPRPCADHPIKACAAALACRDAISQLFSSQLWSGLPPWTTRFGLHHDRVMVGHFGSPDRLNYTALGDGVNLASRLEGLNKQYGTTIIVSESMFQEAGRSFSFRLLDRVAVKGKKQGVQVYELLGPIASDASRPAPVVAYESALRLYWSRDFTAALRLLENQPDDPPSAIVAERCRELLRDPPATDWDGVYISMIK